MNIVYKGHWHRSSNPLTVTVAFLQVVITRQIYLVSPLACADLAFNGIPHSSPQGLLLSWLCATVNSATSLMVQHNSDCTKCPCPCWKRYCHATHLSRHTCINQRIMPMYTRIQLKSGQCLAAEEWNKKGSTAANKSHKVLGKESFLCNTNT